MIDKTSNPQLSFLVIGTFRAGTSWLQSVFVEHPEIFVPHEKELFYFTHNHYRGIEWYFNFYKNVNETYKHIGEICPAYLSDPQAPSRIRSELGDIKIIAILRNPFDQIVSMYQHHIIRGEEDMPFEKAVIENRKYLNNIMYAEHIQNYRNLFSSENLLILFFDDFTMDPKKFLSKIFLFLDVEYMYCNKFNEKINKSGKSKIKVLDNAISRAGEFLRKNDLYFLKQKIKDTGVVDFIKKHNRKGEKTQTSHRYPEEVVVRINSEIKNLEQTMRCDLSAWTR